MIGEQELQATSMSENVFVMALAHVVGVQNVFRSLITGVVARDAFGQIIHGFVESRYIIPDVSAVDLRPNIKDSSGLIR